MRRSLLRGLLGCALAGALSLSSMGCGALQAVTNPGASWALNESPTMTVIVRRAELSRATADQVDRALTEPIVAADGSTFALTEQEAKVMLTSAGEDPAYVGQPVRVVPSEAWVTKLAATCPTEDGHGLLSMLGDDVVESYNEVASIGHKRAVLAGNISKLESDADKDGLSEKEVAALEKKIAKLEKKSDDLEASFEPKADALFAAVKKAASKANKADRAAMTPVVLRLLEAIEDAEQANSAAVIRYPFALPALTTDVQLAAQRFAGDVIEERTGHRPDTKGLSPSVELDGTDIKLTLNGVPAEALGNVELSDVVAETTSRTQDYLGMAVGLMAYASETQERLEFQTDLLEAWRDGLGAASHADVADITDLQVVVKPPAKNATPASDESAETQAEPAPTAETTKPRSLGGLSITGCDAPADKPAPVAMTAP